MSLIRDVSEQEFQEIGQRVNELHRGCDPEMLDMNYKRFLELMAAEGDAQENSRDRSGADGAGGVVVGTSARQDNAEKAMHDAAVKAGGEVVAVV